MNPECWPPGTRAAAGALSGLLLTTAFPPLDQGWVALVALAPLFLALRGASGRAGALAGFSFGAVFFGILLFWISSFGFLAWSLLCLLMAAFAAVFGVLGARASRFGLGWRIVAVPLLWAGSELARGAFPLGGFTWGGLGYTQHGGGSMLGLARVGGVYLLGLAVAVVNALVAELLAERGSVRRAEPMTGPRPAGLRLRVAPVAGAVALVVLPGFLPLGTAGPVAGTLDVAAVQGNVPRDRFTGLGRRGGRTGPEDFTIVENHVRVTERLVGAPAPDLVIWPENALDRDPRSNPNLFEPVVALVRRLRAPFLVGAILDAGERFTNSNLLLSPNGAIDARYDKVHLVPFGEYVPWRFARRLVPVLDRELPVDGKPGARLVPFAVGDATVGSLICFESTYPSLARELARMGSQVIVVSTNNASFGTSPAAREHLAMSRLRAVENGRPVVHAAIAGISAIVMPDGSVVARAGLFRPALLRARLPLPTGRTPYTRYGKVIELTLALGAAITALAPMILSRRARRRTTVTEAA